MRSIQGRLLIITMGTAVLTTLLSTAIQYVTTRYHLKLSFSDIVLNGEDPRHALVNSLLALIDPRNFLLQIGILTILALIISLGLSSWMARPLARRLHHIAHISDILARGSLEMRTGETGRDEIGRLGASLDQMAEAINRQMVELRQLAEENSALVLAVEQAARSAERAVLSRDLHDTISQHLFSLAMGTSNLAALIRRDPVSAAEHAEQLAVIAGQTQDELRTMLTHLRPSAPTKGNLLECLTEWIARWQECYGIHVTTLMRVGDSLLPLLVEDAVLRICQEGLNNVARHAHAHHVALKFQPCQEQLHLEIYDDGSGFDPTRATAGLGLIGMRERVRALGGTVNILTTPGQGTRITIFIPLAVVVEEAQ